MYSGSIQTIYSISHKMITRLYCDSFFCSNWCTIDLSVYIIYAHNSWWRHQMETFSALLAFGAGNSPVTGEFPAQRPVTRSFDIFSDLRLNKRLSKQSWGWWFERHCTHYDVIVMRHGCFTETHAVLSQWGVSIECPSANQNEAHYCFLSVPYLAGNDVITRTTDWHKNKLLDLR